LSGLAGIKQDRPSSNIQCRIANDEFRTTTMPGGVSPCRLSFDISAIGGFDIRQFAMSVTPDLQGVQPRSPGATGHGQQIQVARMDMEGKPIRRQRVHPPARRD
jgi:hypothetical protein